MSIKGRRKVRNGEWAMDLTAVESRAGKCGERGTVQFTPNARARDTRSLRLLQVVKLLQASTKADYNWTGAESRRNQARTVADPSRGVTGGFFVDHMAARAAPRGTAGDAAVSPYYRDSWPNGATSQDGSKQGQAVQPASLWDFPGWGQSCSFTFETAAKGADNGLVYGVVTWGFSVEDHRVTRESWAPSDAQSATFDAAVAQFDETYRNPGASTAPR